MDVIEILTNNTHLAFIGMGVAILVACILYFLIKKYSYNSIQKQTSGNSSTNIIAKRDVVIKDSFISPNDENVSQKDSEVSMANYCERLLRQYSHVNMIDLKRTLLLKDIYIDLNLISNNNSSEIILIDQAIKNQCLVILGNPGGGKTILLQHIAYTYATIFSENSKIPLLIRLSELTFRFNCDIYKWIENNSPKESTVLKKKVHDGQCLLLFDGLDETKHGYWESIREEIERLANLDNQIILTCRKIAYPKEFLPFPFITYEIKGFNEKQQRLFVENFFKDTPEKGTRLLRELQNHEKIQSTLTSPLMLMFIVVLNNNNVLNSPINKVELYKNIIDLLAKRWNDKRSPGKKEKFDPLDKKEFLTEIAFRYFEKDEATFAVNDLLEKVREWQDKRNRLTNGTRHELIDELSTHNGFLIHNGSESYSFIHFTLQEFFTAKYFLQVPDKLNTLVSKHLIDIRWREVFGLFSGLTDNTENFFLKIETEANKYIKSFHLNTLFRWASNITNDLHDSHNSLKLATKRAVAISHVSALERFINRDSKRAVLNSAAIKNGDRSLVIANKILNQKTPNIEDAIKSANTLEVILETAHSIVAPLRDGDSLYIPVKDGKLDISNFSNNDNAFFRNMLLSQKPLEFRVKASDSISCLNSVKIFPNICFNPLIEYLKKIETELEAKQVNTKTLENVVNTWANLLHLSLEFIQLSDDDWEALDNYFRAIELLLYCKEVTKAISSEIWQKIESRILYPIDYSKMPSNDLIHLTTKTSDQSSLLEIILCLDVLINRTDISEDDSNISYNKLSEAIDLLFSIVANNCNNGNIHNAIKIFDDILDIPEISKTTKTKICSKREQISAELVSLAATLFNEHNKVSFAIEIIDIVLAQVDRISNNLRATALINRAIFLFSDPNAKEETGNALADLNKVIEMSDISPDLYIKARQLQNYFFQQRRF